jgi:hypothetical protein
MGAHCEFFYTFFHWYDRFNSAISLLGSSETSARTGAIYALYELAIEEEKYWLKRCFKCL